VELSKGKHSFIEDDITRNINSAFTRIKALKPLMSIAIANKHTPFGTKLKFACIIGAEIGPNGATKCAKKSIIGIMTMKAMKGRVIVNHFGRQPIYQKNCC
jgi:hypothetical protein